MRFLPLFFDLSRGSVVLIGSGAPAIAKLRLLRAAGANVRWFSNGAEAADDLLHARHYAGQIEIAAGEPAASDLAGALAVVSSAGKEADERIASLARAQNVPVNIVDRPDLSTFIFPAVVDRGDVVVAIWHRRRIAGSGAPAAREDRSDPAGAHRRIRRLDARLSRAPW